MEENKVATKLKQVIHEQRRWFSGFRTECVAATIAQAILSSPNLRVELVEPKYKVEREGIGMAYRIIDTANGSIFCERMWQHHAEMVADFLNSKEPK